VRVAAGTTVSAGTINVRGTNAGTEIRGSSQPNVILQGVLSAPTVRFGGGPGNYTHAVGDVFTGPNGGLVASTVRIAFTGRVKNAPYLNASNFRYNYLPITPTAGSAGVSLELEPVTYTTNGTSNGLSAVNILVNGDVSLVSPSYAADVDSYGTTSAVTGVLDLPNTHLVLQSTGDISTSADYYWPGYVYLGTIGVNDDGSAAPGTLGFGTISLAGYFSNVLPGSIANGGGLHFITQLPMDIGGEIRTNANSWVNFGTDVLTTGYAQGVLGGTFVGGTQGAGSVVDYGPLDPSMFHTQAPVATR
jgi:hypothetical protein